MTALGRRVVVVGGGIVGLAVAERVVRDEPSSRVTVLEKEHDWALHQTGRNSGVVHSGLYYPPGSLKARWCAGARALLDLAREEGVPMHGPASWSWPPPPLSWPGLAPCTTGVWPTASRSAG